MESKPTTPTVPATNPVSPTAARIPWLTLAFALLTAAVYGWQGWVMGHAGGFSPEELVILGANLPELSLGPQPWRLVSGMFLHMSLEHLLMNLSALVLVGGALEILIARWKWLVVLLAGGLFASFGTACAHYDFARTNLLGQTIHQLFLSVGISGAIMSLTGAIIAVGARQYIANSTRVGQGKLLRAALIIAGINIVNGFAVSNIDNAAHLSGLAFGLLAGVVLLPARDGGTVASRWLPRLGGGAALVLLAFTLGAQIPPAAERSTLVERAQTYLVKAQRSRARDLALAAEKRDPLHYVDEAEAAGVSIPIPGVAAIVPANAQGRLYIAANDTSSRILEYDATTKQVVRTVANVPYAKGRLWGCPVPSCLGVGISDLTLNPAGTMIYATSVIRGAVSALNVATGHIAYSTHTGRYPNRLLLAGERLYAYDRFDNTLAVLEAKTGRLVQTVDIPGQGEPEQMAYAWSADADSSLAADASALYLINPQARVIRIPFDSLKPEMLPIRHAQTLSTDANGRPWIAARDGVYAASAVPRRIADSTLPHEVLKPHRPHIVDGDGDHPLAIAILGDGSRATIVGISPATGDARRVWTIPGSVGDVFGLKLLSKQSFYVIGRNGAQLMDIAKSEAPGQTGVFFQALRAVRAAQGAAPDWGANHEAGDDALPPPPPPPPAN